jgi:hypothetical protein
MLTDRNQNECQVLNIIFNRYANLHGLQLIHLVFAEPTLSVYIGVESGADRHRHVLHKCTGVWSIRTAVMCFCDLCIMNKLFESTSCVAMSS